MPRGSTTTGLTIGKDVRPGQQRPGRNPRTGQEIPITARRVVTFRPGQKLKARVEVSLKEADNVAGFLDFTGG